VRIALLSFEYPPETGFGGIGSYTWHHARALAKLGHDVHVLAGARQATPMHSSGHDGVHVHRFWSGGVAGRAIESAGESLGLYWTRQRLHNAISMFRGFSALHRRHQFDVVEMPECGAEGALITRWVDVPTVVRLHSPSRLIMPYYDVRPLDIRLCGAIEQQALEHSTALTACSHFVAQEAARTLGIQRPIAAIPNGIDLEWFDGVVTPVDVYQKYGLPRRQLMVLFTGRMERRKGIHLCADIAASILERFDVTFVLAGDDTFNYARQTLLPTLAGRRLMGSVHWLGALPLQQIRELVHAADVFLLPSLWENCPYSCLEAMAAGRAIVAAEQGGIPELIQDDVSGLLAVAGDAQSFVDALERLIPDAPLRAALGAKARQTLEQKHADMHVARRTVRLYEEVIAGGRRAPAARRVNGSAAAPGPFVSIVIPAFNAAETIGDTLRSVRAQRSSAWEAIVVDDGSSDGTAEIAQRFAARDARIRVVRQENRGEAGARNTGVAHARHEWLLFLDADDWVAPEHLERLTQELRIEPRLQAVHCGSIRVSADGTEVIEPYEPPAGDLFPTLARRAAFPVHACIVQQSLVREVGGFDTSFETSTDWDLWQRIARTGAKFGAVREPLAYYRMRPGSASMNAAQLLADGLRVLAQGHAADPRVAQPTPAYADGFTSDGVCCQRFYLLSWCAGLMIGGGRSALPLLAVLPPDSRCPGLFADAIAQCVFESAPLPLGRTTEAWSALWPDAAPRVREFFEALEGQSLTPSLAERALVELQHMIWSATSQSCGAVIRQSNELRLRLRREVEESRRELAAVEAQRWVRFGRHVRAVRSGSGRPDTR
jgi:glycosyltransferase involved in cell wall biosynthesis